MLMEPARATWSRRHHPDRLIVDTLDQVGLAVLPWRDARVLGPGVGVALPPQTNQHRRGGVRVSLGIAAVLVLGDPEVERVAGHERLHPAIAGRAAVIQRQVAIDD